MSKKGKILSIAAVLFLVLSLVAVVPAAITGAQTAGTVQLNRSVYSLSNGSGEDNFEVDTTFNTVTVRVTDADVNTLRTATARFVAPGGNAYDIPAMVETDAGGGGAIQGQDVRGETPTGKVDGINRIFKVANTVLGDRAGGGTAGNDPDGAVDTADVTVRVGGVKVDVVAIGAQTGMHQGADDAAELTVTTIGTFEANGLIGGRVYNLTDGSSGPITDNTGVVITAILSGGDDDNWDENDVYTITEPSGTYTAAASSTDTLTDADAKFPLDDIGDTDDTTNSSVLVGTIYNITDGSEATISPVTNTATATTLEHGGLTATIADATTENDWDTGDVYVINRADNDPTQGFVALAEAPSVGSAITVDYNFYEYDTETPANSPISAVTSARQANDSFGISHFNSVGGTVDITGTVAGNTTLAISFSYNLRDTISDVPISSDTTRLAGASRTIDLEETTESSGIFEGTRQLEGAEGTDGTINENRLQVSDGDTIMVSYTDASPAGTRIATATVDLAPPVITLVEPADMRFTQDSTPSFTVEVTDAGAPIVASGTVDMVVAGTTVSAAKTNVVNGFRLTYLQATAFADGAVEWYVKATDAVGNDVRQPAGTAEDPEQLGSGDRPFTVTIDNTSIASMESVKAGFGLNDAGNMRTRNDNTGIEINFNEAIDTDSIVPGDFNVVGSPDILSARHSATQRNTESTDDALDKEEIPLVEAKDAVEADATANPPVLAAPAVKAEPAKTVYTIKEFTPIDANGDDKVDAKDFSVTVDGEAKSILEASDNTVTIEGLHTTTVAVTYTYNSSAQVFLKVGAELDSDATPAVSLPGDLLDLAGNNAIRGLQRTAADDIAPTITVTLDADTVGDPDNNSDAEGTVTIASTEALAAKPTLEAKGTVGTGDAKKSVDSAGLTFGDVKNVVGSATQWTAEYRSTSSANWQITASGTDSANNDATSEAAELVVDIVDPALASFSPAAVEEGEDLNTALQGLDNIVRVEADFGEKTTVMSSMLNGDDVSANTFTDENVQILALPLDEGTHTWVITVQDEAGNASKEATLAFMVAAPTTFTIPLEPGWNLISVPSRLDAATPGKVFGNESPSVTKVRTWNSTDGWLVSSFVPGEADDPMTEDVDESTESAWVGDILALKQGLGYWVLSSTADDVEVLLRRLTGIPAAPRAQSLTAGWNLVGPQFFNLPSPAADADADLDADDYFISVDWSVAYSFDPDPSEGFKRIAPSTTVVENNLHAGSGYWVFLTEAGELIP